MKGIITYASAIESRVPGLIEEALFALQGRGRPTPFKRRTTADVYLRVWVDFGLFLQVEAGELDPKAWARREAHSRLGEAALHHLVQELPRVNTSCVERYRAALLSIPVKQTRRVGLSNSTVNRHLAAIRHLCQTAMRRGELDSDPTTIVKRRKEHAVKKTPLSSEQILRLLGAISTNTLAGRRNRALIAFLALTGARREEACTLRIDDLDWTEAGLVISLIRKGGNVQKILANGECAEMLKTYIEYMRPPGPLFPMLAADRQKQTAIPMSPNRVTKIMHDISLAVLKRKVGPHALRHAFVTTALQAGAPIQEVQEYVGHADPGTTMTYYHSSIDRAHSAAEYVNLRGNW